MWDECSVPMDGCVARELKEGKDGSGGRDDYEHWVFATTRLDLTDKRMVQTYELRSEIEEDHRQWKNGLWDMGNGTYLRGNVIPARLPVVNIEKRAIYKTITAGVNR